MEANVMRRSCIGVQILMILLTSACTFGWQHLNPLIDDLETPEFEVSYTDLATGRETRSPLRDSDLEPPASTFGDAESQNVFYTNPEKRNTGTVHSKEESMPDLSDASDAEIREQRLIAGFQKGPSADARYSAGISSSRVVARAGTAEDCDTANGGTDCADVLDECIEDPGPPVKKTCEKKICVDHAFCASIDPDAKCVDDTTSGQGSTPKKVCLVPTSTPMPIETPMGSYSGSEFGINKDCGSFPSAIYEIQISGLTPEEKKKKFDNAAAATEEFGYPVCNWRQALLQCVPDYRTPVTTQKPDDPAPPPGGKCKCLLALGEKSIWVDDVGSTKSGISHGKCFIPANKGHHSNCGHDIIIPSGQIEYVKDDRMTLRQYVGKSSNFCAPGSECRTGYNYVGLRCSCKKHHIWDRKTFICKSDGSTDEENGTSAIKISFVVLLLFPLVQFAL